MRGCENTIIPDEVTRILEYAFSGCNGLDSITIPKNINRVWEDAFEGCSGLSQIKVAPENKWFDSRNECNAIIVTATNSLVVGCKNTIIPNTVTDIAKSAFYNNQEIRYIKIPESVESVGYNSFYGCI